MNTCFKEYMYPHNHVYVGTCFHIYIYTYIHVDLYTCGRVYITSLTVLVLCFLTLPFFAS